MIIRAIQSRAEHLTRSRLQQVPSNNQIQCWIGRRETTGVQDPGQSAVMNQYVGRRQIAVSHDIGVDFRELSQCCPDLAQLRDVEQPLATVEARAHPWIVIG